MTRNPCHYFCSWLLFSVLLLTAHGWRANASPAVNGAPDPLSIKVMTLNLHDGKDEKGQDNLAATRRLIEAEQPDLVMLQEVESKQLQALLPTGYRAGVGMNHNLFSYHFGNVILTNRHIAYHHHYYLPSNLEQRGLDEMVIEIDGRYFLIVNTHLGLGHGEQQQQFDELKRIAANFNGPVIITGDFNVAPDDGLLLGLAPAFQEIGATVSLENTFPAARPQERLDQIWHTRHWRVKQARVIPWHGSDHLPVAAELELTEPLLTRTFPALLNDVTQSNNPLLPDAGRSYTRFEVAAAHREAENEMRGSVSLPLTDNLSVAGLCDGSRTVAKLQYRLATIDFRDYLSKRRNVKGRGEWLISLGMDLGQKPWLDWEQYYRWNNYCGTKINVSTETEQLSCRVEQIMLASERLGWFLSWNTGQDISLGAAYTPAAHQAFKLQWLTEHKTPLWQLTWSYQL